MDIKKGDERVETGNYYLISHLVLITGLTDRTIRNYISNGLLRGEMINGMWHFTPEAVEEFIRHPAVKPSILAKKNAVVYDFLLQNRKTKPKICMILDIPGADEKQTAEFFCRRINEGGYSDLSFSFDSVDKAPRVILSGSSAEVLKLANEFYSLQA